MKKKVEYIGILNVTPDSFSDGGAYFAVDDALAHADRLFQEGADLLDIGGQSTRPGAMDISPEEEWLRIRDVVEVLLERFPQKISLDTKHPETAEKFLRMGGTWLNDVTGFQQKSMRDLAVQYKPFCIVNHFPGETLSEVHEQKICSIEKVKEDLLLRQQQLIGQGVSADKIILDPGIGFGKTMDLNWQLLRFAEQVPDHKVLIGHSRKRFLGEHRFELDSNIKAACQAIAAGASYLRVHDIAPYKAAFSD